MDSQKLFKEEEKPTRNSFKIPDYPDKPFFSNLLEIMEKDINEFPPFDPIPGTNPSQFTEKEFAKEVVNYSVNMCTNDQDPDSWGISPLKYMRVHIRPLRDEKWKLIDIKWKIIEAMYYHSEDYARIYNLSVPEWTENFLWEGKSTCQDLLQMAKSYICQRISNIGSRVKKLENFRDSVKKELTLPIKELLETTSFSGRRKKDSRGEYSWGFSKDEDFFAKASKDKNKHWKTYWKMSSENPEEWLQVRRAIWLLGLNFSEPSEEELAKILQKSSKKRNGNKRKADKEKSRVKNKSGLGKEQSDLPNVCDNNGGEDDDFITKSLIPELKRIQNIKVDNPKDQKKLGRDCTFCINQLKRNGGTCFSKVPNQKRLVFCLEQDGTDPNLLSNTRERFGIPEKN